LKRTGLQNYLAASSHYRLWDRKEHCCFGAIEERTDEAASDPLQETGIETAASNVQ